MSSSDELKIGQHHTKSILLFLGCIAFVVACWHMWNNSGQDSYSGKYNPLFLQCIAVVGSLFFGLTGISRFLALLKNTSGVILNEKGIVHNTTTGSGFLIEWQDIRSLTMRSVQSTKFILIHVKDENKYLAKMNPLSRFIMKLNSRWYGTPISIATNSLELKAEEVLTLIREYKKKYRSNKPKKQ